VRKGFGLGSIAPKEDGLGLRSTVGNEYVVVLKGDKMQISFFAGTADFRKTRG